MKRQLKLSSPNRRGFLKSLSVVGAIPWVSGVFAKENESRQMDWVESVDRSKVRALLISATTVAGRGSLEHAREQILDTYKDVENVLLINFASLPEDRDAYEERMQRDFEKMNSRFRVRSLHQAELNQCGQWIREADAVFVSGGNTFLLLRSLYERSVVELLRERALNGMPYIGSSAGSNIAGIEIGTTNDFPICDVPTRRSLGVFPGLYNPHHPEKRESEDFSSRQWKIGQYCTYQPNNWVIGITNPGMLSIRGDSLTVVGEGAEGYLQLGDEKAELIGNETDNVSEILSRWKTS